MQQQTLQPRRSPFIVNYSAQNITSLSFILRRINALCEKYKTLAGEAKEAFLDEYNQHIKRKHDAQQSKAND